MRPGTPGRWIRLRPRVRGTDGSGLATRENPQEAPKKDDFRRRYQSSTVLRYLQSPTRTRRGPCSGRHGEGKRAFENPILNLVLCGGSTDVGVASTAYAARDLDYQLVIASDACTSPEGDNHEQFMTRIFPRMSRVRTVAQVLALLRGAPG